MITTMRRANAELMHCAALVLCAAVLPGQAGAATRFASQPSSVTLVAGQPARFDAAADLFTGVEESSQWQVSSDEGRTWRNLPGPQFGHLALPSVTLADNGKRFRRQSFDGMGGV